MSNWLSDPNNSNRFKQTYVLGFVDVSGNLIVRNGRLNVLGDSSFNGNIYANASITVNKNVYVLGDTSFNGNITCFKDASFSNGLYVGGNVSVFGSDFRLKDVILQKTGVISGNTILSPPLNQIYNIDASGDIRITLPKIASSRLEGSEITFYKSASATNNVSLYSDASDGLVTYGTILSANTFGISGTKTSVKFVVASNKWIEVGSSAIPSVDGSFVNLRVSGNLFVLSDASFGGNMKISGLLRGFNDASFGGNLFVLKDASFGGNVKIYGLLRGFNDASFGANVTVVKDLNIMGNTWTTDIYGNEKYRDMYLYDFNNSIGNTVENIVTKRYDAELSGSGVSVAGGSLNGTLTSNGLKIIPTNTTILNYFTVSSRFTYTQFNNSDLVTLFSIRNTDGVISEIAFTPNATFFTITTNNGDNVDDTNNYIFKPNETYVLKYQQFINPSNPANSSYTITITNITDSSTNSFTGVTTIPTTNLRVSEILCGYSGLLTTKSYSISDFTFGTCVTDVININSTLAVNRDALFNANLFAMREAYFIQNVNVSGNLRGINDASFGGNLTVIQDASFGGNLTVIRDASFGGNVKISGLLRGFADASFGGNLTVIRDASFGGNVKISGLLRGFADASFGGNLFVLRDASFGGNLTVIQDASFGGNVKISGLLRGFADASFGGNLFVLRDASFGGNLTVIRDASFGGNVRIFGNLRVFNDVSFGGNLFLLRDASFGGNLTVIRDASFGGNVRIFGNLRVFNDVSFSGNLFLLRDASFGGNLTVIRDASFGGNVRIFGNLRVVNDASFGGNLFVLRDASFGGNLTVIRDASFGGNVRIFGNLSVFNDVSFGGNLFVLRDASFGGNLTVIRDASFGGNVRIAGLLRGITDASIGGNLFVDNNIVLDNLTINNENILRGPTTALKNTLSTRNILNADSIATSYDGRYVYYIDNNKTDGTNTRSIFKSSNYGETFTLMYNYTNATATYILSKIATNQYGNVVAVALTSGLNGYLLFNESSTNPVATLQSTGTSKYTTGIKMNSDGTYIHLTRHEGSHINKGVYVYNGAGTNLFSLVSSTLNSTALYNVQPLYYTTNNEVFALPAKHTVNSPNSTEIINYVYLYNQYTPSQTISGQVGFEANPFAGVIQTDISEFQFKFVVGNTVHTGCSANTPDNSVKIGFFISNKSANKILKVVANSDSNQTTTSITARCFTSSISPAITITGICCGDTGQQLYIGTTTGLYYMYDPSPMTSDISNNTISLIPGTAGFDITSITCSKTTDYVYFSTDDYKMYRYTSENNVVMEFHPTSNNVGIRNPNPRVELDVAGSVKVDNNLFVSSLTTTNNQVIHQNKFTLLGSTSLLNPNGLYPDSIATSYDGRYVYYLDALSTQTSTANLPIEANSYSRVMKSVDYGKTFTEVYNISNISGVNLVGNTLTKIATNNSGTDIVFQRRLNTNNENNIYYAITYSTNYGSAFNVGYAFNTSTVNINGACLSYNNGGNVVLSGFYGLTNSGIRKLNTISSTTLGSVIFSSSATNFKMYGSKSLYYSGDVFGFLHETNDSVNIPTTLLNFVYYIPSTVSETQFSSIDVNGNLTSVSNVTAIKVSGNLSSYGFTVPSSKIQTTPTEPYMNGNKSTGCSANTPDGSVKIAFIISHSSPTKILKIAYDGKSMFDSCITIPGVTITGVCCGDNGQHLYIATTRGMYYILDTSPMTSNIADQKVMLVSGTEYMNITAITCSRTSEYIFFSTAYGSTNNQLYRLFNNIMFEYVGQDSELLIKPYSGNVGIRNTNPQYELDVGGSVNISNTLYVNTLAISSVRAAGTIYGLTDASFGGNLHVLNDSSLSNVRVSGNLRVINDASFGGNLVVLNDASFGGNLVVVNNGSINRNFRIGGDLTVNGSVTATAFNAMSDKRLKSNIQQLPSQWEKIKMLQPSEYTWRDSYVRDYGFVAQQVFEVYPHMRTKFHSPTMDNTALDEPVNIHGEPQYYSLDYSKMTTMLCKGLQEAMEVIEKQQLEIDGLKRKIDAIQDRLGPDV